jgi:SpoIID/LytB domain protein
MVGLRHMTHVAPDHVMGMGTRTMRRRLCTFLIAASIGALSLSIVPVAAGASGSLSFYGSGDGHGLGMSQWGAYGLANMGWGHRKILTHFYRGTRVDTAAPLPRNIRIGLTTQRTLVHLTAQVHRVRLWIGTPFSGRLVGSIGPGTTWTVRSTQTAYAIRNATRALVGGHTWGSPSRDLFLTYADDGARVFIPEADSIWYDGFAYARGTIEFNLTSCAGAGGCVERLIARLGLQSYLDGLGEVPASWPMQAMEAQAVAARSYAVYAMRHYGIRADCNCHLTDGSGDQTYIGYDRESGTDGGRWVHAVAASRGEIVTYRGAVIQAFYAASDGGHSDSVQDVWHGGDPAYAIPWLTGVCDPGEWTGANPWKAWTLSFDTATLTARLRPYTGSIGTVTTFSHIARADGGRIMTAVAVGSTGSAKVTGTELRAALGLPDDRVWINSNRIITGGIRTAYDGLMCAPGLPASPRVTVPGGGEQHFQTGGLYRNGHLNLTVWLRGVVDDEYRAVGSGGGVLGVPVSAVHVLGGGSPGPSSLSTATMSCVCKRIDFARGRVYWKQGVGAHALWGPVLTAYLGAGGAAGSLGFPTTRVLPRVGGGRRAVFEHGRVECPAGDPCSVVPS